MKRLTLEVFIAKVESALKRQFVSYEIQVLFQTKKSFKANIYLQKKVFIAVPYNARNERMDFALIKNHKRIFGYDNLKQWHYHPYDDPSQHIPCDPPSIEKIILDIKENYELSKRRKRRHGN